MNGDFHDLLAAFAMILTAQHAREQLGLRIGNGRIEGECNPERQANRMLFVTGQKQAAARGVARLALLGLLTKRRDPAEPYRKAETHPGVLAALHGS